jgi:hypothetical protein
MLATILLGRFGVSVSAPAQDRTPAPLPDLPTLTSDRLPNGIRVIHLPNPDRVSETDVEITFGYVPADDDATGDVPDARELLVSYLSLSVPARSVALAAHLAGGEFELLNLADRFGMTVRVPPNNVEAVAAQIGRYFSHAIVNFEILEYAMLHRRGTVNPGGTEADSEMDVEIAAAMFGGFPETFEPLDGSEGAQIADVQRYFDNYLGTDRAFVIASVPLSAKSLDALSATVRRSSTYAPDSDSAGDAVQVELRFPSLPDGGVVIATALPDPRYESWFSALVVDRILRGQAGPEVSFDFPFEAGESIHRIAMPVRLPEYSEDLRDEWIGRIQGVLYDGLSASELGAIQADVLGQLSDQSTLEWFAAHDLWEPLQVGWQMIRGLTSDELRSRALAFAGSRRVIAIWSPMFTQPDLVVEELGSVIETEPERQEPEVGPVPGNLSIPAMSPYEEANSFPVELERLESGITLAEGDEHMIFIAGESGPSLTGGRILKSGANGVLWAFSGDPDAEVFEQLDQVRSDRLLMFYPNDGLASARARFSTWAGGETDASPILALGEVATADLPGLLVLKTWLDAKLIEAGWLGLAQLRIDGLEGSRLIIEAEPGLDRSIRAWITELAEMGIADEDFEQVRNAAMGYFDRIRRELQIILWQRAPEGTVQLPLNFTLARLRDVARLYF